MRAHRGERMDVNQKALGALIARCDPQVSEEFKGRIVIYIIDGLLNARGRGEPFSETLAAFDEFGTARRERYPFLLLEARRGSSLRSYSYPGKTLRIRAIRSTVGDGA